MLAALLRKYNDRRKEKFFGSPLFHTKKKYAFVGVGSHSLANFYPLLRHFGITLKYICTQNSDWSQQLGPLFPGCIFTNDLEDLLKDTEVSGVFVCTSPAAHYTLLTRLLRAGKNVFVEKPPCSTLSELNDLIRINETAICKIGLQRRHWPGNKYAVPKCGGASSYIYQFQTGPYPQGQPLTELFLHPLDYCRFLFGDYIVNSFSTHKDPSGIILQIHVSHKDGVSGLLQLSTRHSWHPPVENIQVNTKHETLTIQYPGFVTGKLLPRRVLNIPAERLLQQPAVTKEYYMAGPSIIPAIDLNSFFVQGFYNEISDFVSLVEGASIASPKNDLPSLLGIYDIIGKITADLTVQP